MKFTKIFEQRCILYAHLRDNNRNNCTKFLWFAGFVCKLMRAFISPSTNLYPLKELREEVELVRKGGPLVKENEMIFVIVESTESYFFDSSTQSFLL